MVTDDGKIAPRSSVVWKEICEELASIHTISPVTLYLLVYNNCYDIHIKIGLTIDAKSSNDAYYNSEIVSKDQLCENSEDSSTASHKSSSTSEKSEQLAKVFNRTGDLNTHRKSFTITLSVEEWERIKPEGVQYFSVGDKYKRTVQMLRRRVWTNIIHEHFYMHTKSPCEMSYSGGKVSVRETVGYIKIHGCSFCKPKFHGSINSIPKHGTPVLVECCFTGRFRQDHPSERRRLIDSRKQQLLQKLTKENYSASALIAIEGEQKMDFGDAIPSQIPSKNALRVAKCLFLKRQKLDENPVLAITKAKYILPYSSFIKDIGIDKFYVMYWSTEQVRVAEEIFKKSKVSEICIDATGSVVKRLFRTEDVKSGNIFLYEIVTPFPEEGKSFVVCNMLSEKHDTESIRHWLTKWICNVSLLPMEVVTDMSMALMSACAQAMNGMSGISEYVDNCFKILLKNVGIVVNKLPRCFLRCDLAHTIHLFSRFQSLRGQIKRTRHFYLRALCLVLHSVDINEVKTLLRHIFILALSETDGVNEKGEKSNSEISKECLASRIAGLDFDILEEDEDQVGSFFQHQDTTSHLKKTRNPFRDWVLQIQEEARSRKLKMDYEVISSTSPI